MGSTVRITKGDVVEEFENPIGHRAGDNMIQIIMENGCQRIVNNFDSVDLIYDEESIAAFKADLEKKKQEFEMAQMMESAAQLMEAAAKGQEERPESVEVPPLQDMPDVGQDESQH
jgi:hypothetical protein